MHDINKPLTQYTMEDLAARQFSINADSGILFARKTEIEQKEIARERIIDLFRLEKWQEPLYILTLPGVDWRFERRLLAEREPGWMRRPRRRRTWFLSAENNRTIYFSAASRMPGIGTESNNHSLQHHNNRGFQRTLHFAEYEINSEYSRFFFCNVDDLMTYAVANRDTWQLDATWLDYTGPLTIRRLVTIASFYRHCVRHNGVLVITALKARWDRATGDEIAQCSDYEEWLSKYLPGEKLHFIEYFDTSPMLQFAVRKFRRPPRIGLKLMRWGDDGGRNLD